MASISVGMEKRKSLQGGMKMKRQGNCNDVFNWMKAESISLRSGQREGQQHKG
jgi:hypothetical protein